MNLNKKVILFIVEGISDEQSLSLIISRLIKDNSIKFYVVGGDISSNKFTTQQNCINKVGECIKNFLNINKFKKSDLLKVVHLVDTDGAYVGKEYIKEGSVQNLVYNKDSIITNNKEMTIKRNIKKASILNKLYGSKSIMGIEYVVYYFSSNLEHVLHNEQNLDDSLKCEYADNFIEMYDGREEKFIEFLNDNSIAVLGDYNETWEFIKVKNNSLNRNCNLHLFFKERSK